MPLGGPSQLEDIQRGHRGHREGQTEDAEVEDTDEQVVHPDIEEDAGQADAQRDARFVDGGKGRAHYLDAGVGNETEGVAFQGKGGEGGILGRKTAVLVNGGDDRLGQKEESDRRRQGEEEGLSHPHQKPVVQGCFVVECRMAGKVGQSDGGHGHAEKADGKLDQPKGVVEAGDGTVLEVGCEVAVHENVDLDGRGSD